jgi:hypothetical protein
MRPIVLATFFFALLSPAAMVRAEENKKTRFAAADSDGVLAFRDQHNVYLELSDQTATKSVAIPRLAAPIVGVNWLEELETPDAFKVHPEPNHWVISWESRPETATTIQIQLGDQPVLLSELEATGPTGDGSILLPAHRAATSGEKVRYEPQTHKNTVGYWVGKQDTATWKLVVDSPGKFNVAILQGCGTGQGGSQVRISLDAGGKQINQLDFEVQETGHFQNFQWRHLGEIEVSEAGEMSLTIAPIAIKNNALMDVRAIHLVRRPPGS